MQRGPEGFQFNPREFGPEAEFVKDRKIAKAIVMSGAFQTGDFLFSSGEKGEMKIVVEELLRHSKYTNLVIDSFMETIRINQIEFDKICGVITGGARLAHLLGERLNNKEVITRLGKKRTAGKREQVYGEIKQGDRLLYVEDVVTSGENTQICVNRTRKEGAIGEDLLGVMTYGTQVSYLRFEELQIKPHFVTNIEVVLEAARHLGTIDWRKFEELVNWRKKLDEDLITRYS